MTLRQLIDEELDLTNFEKQYGQLMQSLNNFSEQAKNVYNDPNILKNFENLIVFHFPFQFLYLFY